uniref:CCHC-type domain-containing protein n=1 Tax=Neogobius melanostomus TaxID=47308 RepID=A0A8C6SWF4_9GOBI
MRPGDNPPAFAEFLLLLRTEEDRQQAKESLMKKHMGTKQHAHLHSQQACSCDHSESNAISEMKEQLEKLQKQMSLLLSRQQHDTPSKSQQPRPQKVTTENSGVSKPRPGFCFKCGEDGHIAPTCSNKANPALVQRKTKAFEQRLQRWDHNQSQQSN